MVQSLTFAKTAMLRSLNRPCAASSSGRLRQQRNRFSVIAAASPDKKDDKDLRLSRMLSVNMSKEDRAKLSEGLKRLGVKDASDLRKALLKQEAVVALRIALDAGINTCVCGVLCCAQHKSRVWAPHFAPQPRRSVLCGVV